MIRFGRPLSRGSRNASEWASIRPAPRGFTLDAAPFVFGTVLEDADPDGLYHVTTHLDGVLAHGGLLSRAQLAQKNVRGAGLGGGWDNQAPNRVSVSISLSGSIRLARAIRVMAHAVRGQISAKAAVDGIRESLEPAMDELDGMLDMLREGTDDSEDETDEERADAFEAEIQDARDAALRARPGPELYIALQSYEQEVYDAVAALRKMNPGDEDRTCTAVVGFTESSARFARVNPSQVALLRLAGKKGAKVDFVPNECELRFSSVDLSVVDQYRGDV